MIERRDAIERLTLMFGGALAPQITAGLMGQVTNAGPSVEINEAKEKLIAEIADVIIPDTDTPGAKAAGVEKFIVRLMRDCYELKDQESFFSGIDRIEKRSTETYQKSFIDLNEEEKTAVMNQTAKKDKNFFRQLKVLTTTGYFTSEIGATQALVYLPIPGQFKGDVPLKPGQKAWAISR